MRSDNNDTCRYQGLPPEKRGASLGEIAAHFKADPAYVESMLDRWVRKGSVEMKTGDVFSNTCCGKCCGHRTTWYQWIEG
ncbi:MAG: hypothetical protein FJZ79_09045 [Chlorobi bacterium]|nr:hypothetical protein [Chlorobiota bacterium]